jgi:chromosome segregation ATPase
MPAFTPSSSVNGRPSGISLDPASARANGAPTEEEAATPGGWDSTIGKAGLGKTGRVINKLVDENETLKREIKLERLRAEEARQAAKLIEDKMERTVAEYESRLLEANVARTLLARKERQLEELTANVERQRQRADAAADRERGWRDELEKVRSTAAQQVEEATTRAELMEGRYNVLSAQWGTHDATIQKLRDEIKAVRDERARDDERIGTLHDLCDQQDTNIRNLAAEKDRIGDQFEAYKRAQEDGLRSIKDKARAQEEAQERLLEETREALHKLKWALQVNGSAREVDSAAAAQ